MGTTTRGITNGGAPPTHKNGKNGKKRKKEKGERKERKGNDCMTKKMIQEKYKENREI